MRDPDKPQQIIEAAVRVFARKGYYNSRVSDVAREAGIAAGTIYLYFKTKVPYAVAMIDLDEGVRIMTNIVDTPLAALAVGTRVEVLFEDAGGGIAIPLFRASPSGGE